MTNKVGTTFVAGKWYKSNHNGFFFQYVKDREDESVNISARFCKGALEGPFASDSYVNNADYIDNATLATNQELLTIGVIKFPITNNSYSIF